MSAGLRPGPVAAALLRLARAVHSRWMDAAWLDAWEEVARLSVVAERQRKGSLASIWRAMRELVAAVTRSSGGRKSGDVRSRTTGGAVMTMGEDVRYAMRLFRRDPGGAAVILLTLALSIGAVTAVFGVSKAVLIDTLAYPDPDRVVMIGESDLEGDRVGISWLNLRDWEEDGLFESVAAYVPNSVAVAGDGDPERIRGFFVSSTYFEVVGVAPVLGRSISADEDAPGDARTAVLSWGWWQRRFGGDPDILGRVIRLNNESHTVVGIMPEGFRSHLEAPEAWISLHTAPRAMDRGSRGILGLGRLPAGTGIDAARGRLTALTAAMADQHPETNAGWGGWIESAAAYAAGSYRTLLLGLLASVGVLLLIAGANIAGVQVARVEARSRELAVRSSLGASRWRLVRQLLVENIAIAAIGGGLGLGLAYLGVDALVALQPGLGVRFDPGVDRGVLLAGAAVSILTAVGFGLLPALTAAGTRPGHVLREGGRGASGSRRGTRARSALVTLQLALSLSLLVNAGLLVRTLTALGAVDPGFDPEGMLTFEFRLVGDEYASDQAVGAFFDELVPRLEAIPGARAVTTAGNMPFADQSSIPFIEAGADVDVEQAPWVQISPVWTNFTEVFGLTIVRGRGLDPDAGPADPVEALVSERVADELFAGDDVLGGRFYISEELDVATVVGVVNDVQLSLTDGPVRSVWINQRQRPSRFSSIAIRTDGDPMRLANQAREAVRAVDPDQPIWEVMPLEERMANTVGNQRFAMTLLSAFGLLAALLAAVGIYGVMAQHVGARRRELGVRMALGANRVVVLRMVMRQSGRLVAIGMAGGLAVALLSATLLESMLFGVTARDPLTFLFAAVVLGGAAAVATVVPARRATRVDAARTLQER